MEFKNRIPLYAVENFNSTPLALEDATFEEIKREKEDRIRQLKLRIARMKERLHADEEELKKWESL